MYLSVLPDYQFPIADGDTGTNMVICIKNPLRNLFSSPCKSITTATTNFAADVLLYGQGNSGTILSHFFISLSNEVRKLNAGEKISLTQFAAVLSATGKQMDNAVANSVDGTIVSVARDCCQGIDSGCNLQAFMTSWAANARRELKKTPDQLKDPKTGKYVLKEAGVVDSGGQGFVYMVEGMSMAAPTLTLN